MIKLYKVSFPIEMLSKIYPYFVSVKGVNTPMLNYKKKNYEEKFIKRVENRYLSDGSCDMCNNAHNRQCK